MTFSIVRKNRQIDAGRQRRLPGGGEGRRGAGVWLWLWQRRSHAAAATTAAGQAGPGVAYGCLDWSQRRDHLAGPLARALLLRDLEQGCLQREPKARALRLTPQGQVAMGAWLAPDPQA